MKISIDVKSLSRVFGVILFLSMTAGCRPRSDQEETVASAEEKKKVETPAGAPAEDSSQSSEAAEKAAASDPVAQQKKRSQPYEVNPNEPCDHCEKRLCTNLSGRNLLDECYNGEDAELCKKLVDCAAASKCGIDHPADCFCGDGVTITECLAKGGSGPCKAEVEAAAKSKDASVIAVRFADPEYAVGRAMGLVDCKRSYCPKCNE